MNRRQTSATKRTHKLQPQTTVLWIAAMRSYLERYSPSGVSVVDTPDKALHLHEDRASITALNFKMRTGMSAAVRPYYTFQ